MRAAWFEGIAVVLCVLMLCAVTVGAQVSATASGSITGQVADPSGAPIPGAQVTATNEAATKKFSIRSDSRGSYNLSGLPPGNYKVSFASQGFKTENRDAVLVANSVATQLDVKLTIGGGGPHVEVMPAAPPESTGAIRGTVVDPAGAPIEGVQVTITDNSTAKKRETKTDCAGDYQVVDLALGSYSVRFEKKLFRTENRSPVYVGASLATDLVIQLPVGDYMDSGPVAEGIVPSSAPKPGPTGTIRGRVTDSTGLAIPARITVFGQSVATTTTDSEGTYHLSNIPKGPYCLAFETGEQGTTRLPSAVVVSSSQDSVMDIRAADSQKVEVCTDSCPIETWTKPPVHPEISLYLYAESNIAVASAPFWLTLTFTNQTKHSVSLETLENSASTYRLYAFGRCACPGALGKLLSAAGMLTPRPRLRRGGTFTEKIDLGKLMDLSAASPWGPTYRIGVRRFDMTRGHENSEVISNLITVTVMPAPR